ncbi:MAG TPA: C4-type zinc ribbon domain-containing protein [Candidatus Krumholzibacteria bacterium]|nr:C4-type zinc ribbon domain-containing protein [Candidatus Krumholzibacteria bacterium]
MTDLRRDISLFVSVARIEASLHNDRLELQKLPIEIAKLDRAIAELDAREKTDGERVEALGKARRETERALREHEEHLRKCRGQQSLVKTNEEYTAMLKEIANLEKAIGEDEEKILVLMDDLDAAQQVASSSAGTIATERAKLREQRQALDARATALAVEVDRLTREKPKILAEISPPLLKRYERLADRFGDLAVTRVENEHCGACRHQVQPQVAVEVRNNDQLITCQSCGRILVHYAD